LNLNLKITLVLRRREYVSLVQAVLRLNCVTLTVNLIYLNKK
jgi:hypothetical protein